MKIIFHAVAIHKRGGGSRHLEGFIQSLGELDHDNEYLLCLDRRLEYASPWSNITVYPVEIKSLAHRLWWDQVRLPRLALARRADMVVSLMVFGMFWPTIPQISFQRNSQFYCDAFLSQLGGAAAWDMILRRTMAYWTMCASRVIVTPAAAMRDMIRRYHPDLPIERFRVLPHGFDRAQLICQSLPEAISQQLTLAQGRPVILYVSHLEPHKGMDVVIRAMRELKRQEQRACLCLTMDRRDWPEGYDRVMSQVRDWGLAEDVFNLGRVPEGALDELYQRADVFLFPSLCEAFGFPMVEALGYGLPIVAADTPINRELCGEAALYYAPQDAIAAARQLQVLLDSPERRRQASAASELQFPRSHLTWLEYARQFLTLVQGSLADGT
jgi:glycosyltransferase involved in cell wall biosynthesis